VQLRKLGLLSIVSPAYNEGEVLRSLCEQVLKVMEAQGYKFELIIVNDGSTDSSLEILRDLHKSDGRIHYLNLSRNFGTQGALMAGFEHSSGDVVISIDADLQNPPDLIPKMVKAWENGYDVVNAAKRENKSVFFLRRFIDRFFYAVFNLFSGIKLRGHSDFRLMDRMVVNVLCRMPEGNKFLRGLTSWIGFNQTSIEYDVPSRYLGRSHYQFIRLAKLAVDAIFSFSKVPIRLFTLIGVIVSFGAFLYGSYFVVLKIIVSLTDYDRTFPPGWMTIVIVMLFLGGIQLMGIGLLGEYLGRVFDEVKGRPSYLIREGTLKRKEHSHKDDKIIAHADDDGAPKGATDKIFDSLE